MPLWNWQIERERERRHRALLDEISKIAGVEIAEEADDAVVRKRDQEEEPMTKLEKILKGETRPTRERFADAVRQEAVRLGKSEAALWEDVVLRSFYEDLPKATAVPVRLHKAALDATELLQKQFERVRKTDPTLSVNAAYDAALSQLERPVRDQYFADAGRSLNPLDEAEIRKARRSRDGDLDQEEEDDEDTEDDGDGTECANCGEDTLEPGDRFCSNCGAPVKAAKRRTTA